MPPRLLPALAAEATAEPAGHAEPSQARPNRARAQPRARHYSDTVFILGNIRAKYCSRVFDPTVGMDPPPLVVLSLTQTLNVT